MIGDETVDGFKTLVPTYDKQGRSVNLQIPNFTSKKQKDVIPKIVLNAWISYLPFAEQEIEEEDKIVKITSHEAKIQIDIISDSELQVIDITKAVVDRFDAFFEDLVVIPFEDPFEWEDYNSIKVNPNYDTERNIIKYGSYTLVDSVVECESTANSWFLNDEGLYVNGDINLTIEEKISGMVFPEGDNAYQRGFRGLNKNVPLRELPGAEDDDEKFSIEYELTYDVRREVAIGGVVDDLNVEVEYGEE